MAHGSLQKRANRGTMKTVHKIFIGAFAAIGVISTGTMIATPAFAQDKEPQVKSGPMTTPVAKISPVQAMRAAEAKVGGKATMVLFEFDEGHWIYGVVVVKNQKLMEVDVDPVTGKAGDHEEVTPEDEAKEFQDALSKMMKGSS
jgi:uncharacterized membrane protein YkoI